MTQMPEHRQKSSSAKSVSKTLAILATFDEMSPRQRTSDIAEKLHMNISTVSRHLNTLLDWGFLSRDESTGFYYAGLQIIALAGASLQNNDIYRHAFPELQQLSYKYGVQSHMAVPREGKIIHLINLSCENTMELLMPMGHSQPMYCSAMGRALLAFMPAGKTQEILKKSELVKFTPDTKVDLKEINAELAHTRRKGYCVLIGELLANKGSLAAPIFDQKRNPVAVISVSASARSISIPERERELAKAVMSTASRISGKLGYFPN